MPAVGVNAAVPVQGTRVNPPHVVEIELSDVWFYDRDMVRQIPEVDLQWVTVAFQAYLSESGTRLAPAEDEQAQIQMAQSLVADHEDFAEYLCDRNLSKEACFFKLRQPKTTSTLKQVIDSVNRHPFVRYTHPTIRVKGKTYAFLDTLDLEWKTGVDLATRQRILDQVHVASVSDDNLYQVDVSRIAFFKALNLLAEDVTTRWAVPRLIELKPSIELEFEVPLIGANIGDKVTFALTIRFAEFIQVDPSSVANIGLRPANLQKELFEYTLDAFDRVETAARSPIRITGWFQFFAPGDYVVPPIRIRYTCTTCPNRGLRSAETQSLPFRVSSIVPPGRGATGLIVPQDVPTPEDTHRRHYNAARLEGLLATGFFALTGLCLIWWAVKLNAARKEAARDRQTNRVKELATALEAFLAEPPAGPHSSFMAECSKRLRQYLVERYRIRDAARGGSGEVFFQSIRNQVPQSLSAQIHGVLKQVDEAVAQELEVFAQLEPFNHALREILYSTRSISVADD